jgi:hypothetical protein
MTAKPKAKEKPFALEDAWPKIKRETRLLTAIHPYPLNPRTHPPAQVAFLAGLLKKYGPDQDIVVDAEDDMILKGHGRRLAAIAAGMKDFPVTVRFDLSEAEKKAMRIEDNQSALMSGWDNELLRTEATSLKSLGYDINLLGFGEAQLVQFMTTPGPPNQFPAFGSDIHTDYECPHCGYKWSGKPTPASDGDRPSKPPPKLAAAKKKR